MAKMYWMPETGNHALAEKLHKQLEAEGLVASFGSGNKAGDITYTYSDGKNKAYLLARRNGFHEIKRKYAEAHGKGSMQDVQPVGKETPDWVRKELPIFFSDKPKYSPSAVQKEINKDKRIGGKEAKAIHALLKGRTGDSTFHDKLVTALVKGGAAAAEPIIQEMKKSGMNNAQMHSAVVAANSAAREERKKATDETYRVFDSGEVVDVTNEVKPVGDAEEHLSTTMHFGTKNAHSDLPAKRGAPGAVECPLCNSWFKKSAKGTDSSNKALAPIVKVIPRSKRPKAEDVATGPGTAVQAAADKVRRRYVALETAREMAKKVSDYRTEQQAYEDAKKDFHKIAGVSWLDRAKVMDAKPPEMLDACKSCGKPYGAHKGGVWCPGDRETKWKATDSESPFDIDTDAGAAKIVKREAKAGLSAKQIAKKHGFSLSFVEEEMPGTVKRVGDGPKENPGIKTCKHTWQEVDAEPPYDVCNSCGAVRY